MKMTKILLNQIKHSFIAGPWVQKHVLLVMSDAMDDRNGIFYKIVQGGFTQQQNILWLSTGWVHLSSAIEMVCSKLSV